MPSIGNAGIVLEGVPELSRRLEQLERDVRRKMLTETLLDASEITRERAADLAPQRTGRLRREQIIKHISSESTSETAVVKVGPSKNAFYGLFQEIGTAHMTSRPFLGPAFEQTKDDVLKKFADDLLEKIRDITHG